MVSRLLYRRLNLEFITFQLRDYVLQKVNFMFYWTLSKSALLIVTKNT